MSANQNINTVQDYEDVLAAMEGYVSGLKTGNVSSIKKDFSSGCDNVRSFRR